LVDQLALLLNQQSNQQQGNKMIDQDKVNGFAIESGKRNIQIKGELTQKEYMVYMVSLMGLMLTDVCVESSVSEARKLTAKIITGVTGNIRSGK